MTNVYGLMWDDRVRVDPREQVIWTRIEAQLGAKNIHLTVTSTKEEFEAHLPTKEWSFFVLDVVEEFIGEDRKRTEANTGLELFQLIDQSLPVVFLSSEPSYVPPAIGSRANIKVIPKENQGKVHTAIATSVVRAILDLLERSYEVTPFWGKPDTLEKRIDVFVAMPFKPTLEWLHKEHICVIAKKLGLQAERVDTFSAPRQINKDIWNSICACACMVAVCDGRNANVYYEAGLAHAIGKDVVFIANKSDYIVSDISSIRYHIYTRSAQGKKRLDAYLEAAFREMCDVKPTDVK